MTSIESLNSRLFGEHLHSAFKVALPEPYDPIVLELTEVVEHNKVPKVESFSVFFRGPLTPILQQGIKRMEHEQLGVVEIFITPVGQEPEGYGTKPSSTVSVSLPNDHYDQGA